MKIVFMGTPDFAVPSLHRLIKNNYDVIGVVTQPDRPRGRKKVLTPPPVKEAALSYDLPILQPEKLRGSKELEQILAWQPDLIVTAAYGQILPSSLLEAPRLGCINVHASLLPKYRGGAPIHQAIIDGEEETGVTIMYMVKALDAGDILTQVSIPIEEEDDVGSLFEKLSLEGAQLLEKTIPQLIKGEITPQPQNEAEVTYAYNIKREDEEIDWQKDGKAIYNQIRGLRPFPGSFTYVEQEVYKIWRAKKTNDHNLTGKPGSIYRLDEEGIGVVAGDQTGILITEIQPAGKKRMSAEQFYHGLGKKWSLGKILG